MKSVDGKTFSAYVRSKLHSGYITIQMYCIKIKAAWHARTGNYFSFVGKTKGKSLSLSHLSPD